MRKNRVVLGGLLAFAVVLAVVAAPIALAAGKTHEVKTEVVSVNVETKMLTIKDEKGASKAVPVLPSAVASLKNIKAGDKVVLTCQDTEKGEHQGIAAIRVETAPMKKS